METLKFLMVSTHFPPHHIGGDAVFVRMLSDELIKAGHEVQIFYNPKVYESIRKRRPETPRPGSERGLSRNPYAPVGGSLEMLAALSIGRWGRALRKLEDIETETKPDVVHWHNTRGFIGVPVRSDRAVNLLTAHDYAIVCPKSNLLKPDMSVCRDPRWCTFCSLRSRRPPQLWRAGSRRVLRIPEGVLVLSPSEFLARRLADDGCRVQRVLHNFAPDIQMSGREGSAERDALVYIGIVERHKGVGTLVDAFDKSKNDHGLKLVIIGEGAQRAPLLEHIKSRGLDDRIRMPGFLAEEQVAAARRSALAQVIPSEWLENAPLSALESLSMGVPLITSDIGGLPEIATDDAASHRFPAGDSGKLADALVRVWNARDEISGMSKSARLAYETNYTPRIHLRQYLQLIAGAVRR